MNKQYALNKIAAEKLDLKTLETRNSDELDFKEMSVWEIKAALEAAWDAGRAASRTEEPKKLRIPRDFGTPKTLVEAIQNGIDEDHFAREFHLDLSLTKAEVIEVHVRDFIAQKFTTDLMDLPPVRALWRNIVGKKVA